MFRIVHSSFKHHFPKIKSTYYNHLFTKGTNLKPETNLAFLQNVKVSNEKLASSSTSKVVGLWFLSCSGMVFGAVALGGITRLTESGLSMVTWKLLGEKMPTDEVSWLTEFEKYKQFPEFQITNKNMSLEEFKRIWWMEYMHRMWGRLTGAVFLIPAGFFWANRMLSRRLKTKVLILGSLIGCQGLMGWYMVKSGLENDFSGPSDVPRVSQYRLASHFGLALIIYTGFLYSALEQLLPVQNTSSSNMTKLSTLSLKQFNRFKSFVYMSKGLIFLTAISGAFVAGLDAGLVCDTFPKMFDKWIPEKILAMEPAVINIMENPVTVQFNHRVLGISSLLSATCVGLLSWKYKLRGRTLAAALAVTTIAYLQATLGISTLMNNVPINLAASHQSNSLLLLSSIIWLCHELNHLKRFVK